jgi:alpha-1,4-galacturonosyltransferase
MVRPAGLLDPTRRRPFLDQRRPSFRRRWQQRPLWVRLGLSLVLLLACVLLLLGLAGSPDPSSPPATHSARSDAAVSSPLLRQVTAPRLTAPMNSDHFALYLLLRILVASSGMGRSKF